MITSEERVRFRVAILGIIVLAMMSVLLSRLWFLQVLTGERYAHASENNRVRIVWLEAPRGRILDRNGVELAKNRPSLAVGLRRDDLRDPVIRARVVKRLSQLLNLSERQGRGSVRDVPETRKTMFVQILLQQQRGDGGHQGKAGHALAHHRADDRLRERERALQY